jgi:glycosyltransferase involved in cell wall biosynthesis
MKHNPLVSIIVRTKDRPKLLQRAIQSIAAQTYRPIEIVLVNDGGCDLNIDELKSTLCDVDLNYIRLEENTGRAHAGNVGIEHAHGDYIGFLDDDDEYYPVHVLTLTSFLEQSDYEVAYSDSVMVYKEYNPQTNGLNNDVKKEVIFSQDFNYDRLVFENYIPFMCLLFKREPLVNGGGFDTGFELYEDWDLLIRIGKKNPFYHLKQVTAIYNQWSMDLQISQRNRDLNFLQQAYLEVISRHIEEVTPKRIHAIVSEFVQNRQTLKDLRNEFESQKTYMRECDAQKDALSSGMKEKDVQISGYAVELQDKTSRIEALNGELRNRDAQIDALSSGMKAKDTQISGYAAELQDKTSRIEVLNGELRNRDAQIDALSSGMKAKDTQISGYAAELQDLNARLNSLVSSIACKDEAIMSLQNAIQGRDALITAMKNTRGWKILEKYRRVRDSIVGSKSS